MPDTPARLPRPPFAAVIVAAGKGLRAGGDCPKQFAQWRGKPLVRHSVEAMVEAGARPIVIAIPDGAEEIAGRAVEGLPNIRLVTGGVTRQASVRAALESLEADDPERVLIHDAARPVLPQDVIHRLHGALNMHEGAIPVLPVVDSLAAEDDGFMQGMAEREKLRRVQTPQAFRFAAILAAHRAWPGSPDAGDDAQVAHAAGIQVALIEGDETMRKMTFAADLATRPPAVRTGIGYDVHRLADGEALWLCGVRIDHPRGLAGHSDADVAIHALVDALLGAIGDGDIGSHFPPSDPQWKGASSDRFLAHAVKLVRESGYDIGNVDVTIICEAPKIGPHRQAMRERIAEIMGADVERVSIKATTTERLGFTGRGEGIAAQAVASVVKADI